MSPSSVWLQLYYKEKEEPEGQIFKIKPVPDDVDALAEAVKSKRPNALSHCDSADLSVYPPGTTPPFSKQTSIRADKILKELIKELGNKNPAVTIDYDHPLIVVAPQPPQQQQLQSPQLDVDAVAERIAKKMKETDGPTKTSVTRGKEELERLRRIKCVTQVTLNQSLPPILSTKGLQELQKNFTASAKLSPRISPHEAALTALLTPTLAGLVQEVAQEEESGLVLSNTEYIQWLPPRAFARRSEWKKPDLLTAHPSVLISRESNGGDGILNFRTKVENWSSADRFFGGVEPSNISNDFVSSLWEGRCKLGNMHEALGEMADNVSCTVIKNSLVSFVLYDKDGFVCGYANMGRVANLQVGNNDSVIPWNANGSKEVLKNLLKTSIPPRMKLMESIRSEFKITGWIPIQGQSPYLGSGAFGDVYCVSINGKKCALKVAKEGQPKKDVKAEFDTLKQAQKDGAPVVHVLMQKHNDDFSAYTMKPVGTPVANRTPEFVSKLFSSLFALHSYGWYHGDARWQNVIEFEGKLLWCDFRSARKHEALVPDYRTYDLQSLAESILSSAGRKDQIPKLSSIELKEPLMDYLSLSLTFGWVIVDKFVHLKICPSLVRHFAHKSTQKEDPFTMAGKRRSSRSGRSSSVAPSQRRRPNRGGASVSRTAPRIFVLLQNPMKALMGGCFSNVLRLQRVCRELLLISGSLMMQF